MRLRRKSIRGIIEVEDGSKLISVVSIEGEKIGLASMWLGSPYMASLALPSLGFSRCFP